MPSQLNACLREKMCPSYRQIGEMFNILNNYCQNPDEKLEDESLSTIHPNKFEDSEDSLQFFLSSDSIGNPNKNNNNTLPDGNTRFLNEANQLDTSGQRIMCTKSEKYFSRPFVAETKDSGNASR